ncbi:hypothetical protein IC232_13860 [Microvirga sp. BT688]|uniref:hypothetical protein n=1 Tax=Microvirga sp. TaxID=1873136 RepID=UPI001683CC07|nr:hypothetical protein [Microvirga sp.]MBD2747785.1 hypothetical protein [Microvirga sp.]
MIGQFIGEYIQRQPPSQRKQLPRRQWENDEGGTKQVTSAPTTKSEKGRLKPPTNAEQSELLQAAIESGLRDKGLKELAIRQEVREWEHVFSKSYARHLHALNPYARERWSGILQEVIDGTAFDNTPWMVTIIADDWMFSTYPRRPSESDLRWVLSRMRKAVQRGLRGAPYLLQADFAVRRYEGSRRVAIEVHWHGLVWATAKQIAAIKKRFPATRFGADRFHARDIYDLRGAIGYMAKDTRFGYRTVKNFGFQPGSQHQKKWFQFREAIYGPQRRLLIAMIGNLKKPDLCAASGMGLRVLRQAKQLARDRGYRGGATAPAQPRGRRPQR